MGNEKESGCSGHSLNIKGIFAGIAWVDIAQAGMDTGYTHSLIGRI